MLRACRISARKPCGKSAHRCGDRACSAGLRQWYSGAYGDELHYNVLCCVHGARTADSVCVLLAKAPHGTGLPFDTVYDSLYLGVFGADIFARGRHSEFRENRTVYRGIKTVVQYSAVAAYNRV